MAFQITQPSGRYSGARAPCVPVLAREVTVDNNDKTLDMSTVLGAMRFAHLVGGRLAVTATSTVGNRTLRLEVLEDFGSGDVVVYAKDFEVTAAAPITASQTRNVELAPSGSVVTGGANEDVEPIDPALFLHGNQKLRIYDSADVDGNDDMLVYLRLLVY